MKALRYDTSYDWWLAILEVAVIVYFVKAFLLIEVYEVKKIA